MRDPAFELLGDAPEWTLSRVLRRQAARHGERRFIRFGGGTDVSFAGYDSQCDDVARGLLASGVQSGDVALHEPAPHEIACIMYTSGTTGPAKGVLMPHAHVALFSVPSPGLRLTERDTYYVCMPLFHANALFVQVLASLVCGAQVHC